MLLYGNEQPVHDYSVEAGFFFTVTSPIVAETKLPFGLLELSINIYINLCNSTNLLIIVTKQPTHAL